MTLHLIKLCVGAASIEDLEAWQRGRIDEQTRAGETPKLFHRTFQTPKRQSDLLDGGSLYWVIKGAIQARQRIVALEEGRKDDGSRCCLIVLDKTLIAVRPTPRRAFQGWRYLDAADAPADLARGDKELARLPPQMRRELAELCLI